MQNQIQSYTFPLIENCHNSFISSLRNRQFLIGTSIFQLNRPSSYIHFFKFDEQNPKKSTTVTKQTEGTLLSLSSSQLLEGQELSLAVIEENNQYFLKRINNNSIQANNSDFLTTISSQSEKILGLCFKKFSHSFYINEGNSIHFYDMEKQAKTQEINQIKGEVTSILVDPIHQFFTYSVDNKNILICHKNSMKEKYIIKASQGDDTIHSIDYNPNKQYYLMTTHYEGMKFWDIRKGNLPVKSFDDHHSLLVEGRYNHSHDQLITCAYDDGSVGLFRMSSVSSSPQGQSQDSLVKLYDEHEDSVYRVCWSAFSPWTFASLTYNASNLVINMVPSVQKYRILL